MIMDIVCEKMEGTGRTSTCILLTSTTNPTINKWWDKWTIGPSSSRERHHNSSKTRIRCSRQTCIKLLPKFRLHKMSCRNLTQSKRRSSRKCHYRSLRSSLRHLLTPMKMWMVCFTFRVWLIHRSQSRRLTKTSWVRHFRSARIVSIARVGYLI